MCGKGLCIYLVIIHNDVPRWTNTHKVWLSSLPVQTPQCVLIPTNNTTESQNSKPPPTHREVCLIHRAGLSLHNSHILQWPHPQVNQCIQSNVAAILSAAYIRAVWDCCPIHNNITCYLDWSFSICDVASIIDTGRLPSVVKQWSIFVKYRHLNKRLVFFCFVLVWFVFFCFFFLLSLLSWLQHACVET